MLFPKLMISPVVVIVESFKESISLEMEKSIASFKDISLVFLSSTS